MKSAVIVAVIMWSLVAAKAMHDNKAKATDGPNAVVARSDSATGSGSPAASTATPMGLALQTTRSGKRFSRSSRFD